MGAWGNARSGRLGLVPLAILALSATLSAVAAPQADAGRTNTRSKPVLMMHGLYRGDMNQVPQPRAVDCWSRFDKMTAKLRERGYTGRFDMIKFYAYDYRCGYTRDGGQRIFGCDALNCTDPNASSGTNINVWGKSPGAHDHYVSSEGHCPIGGDPCPPAEPYPNGGHNSNAPLQHIAYHLAWYIYGKYSSKGKAVDMAVSSMSGMAVQYAIAQTERHHPDFPPYLKVEDVVLFADPHGGAEKQPNSPCDYVQCTQMGWPNSTLGFEDADEAMMVQWLANRDDPARWEPDGKGGTDWTDMGSEGDSLVRPWNAVGTNQEHTTKATFGGCHKLWYRMTDTLKLGHGDFIKDASNAKDAPVWKEPKGTCTGNLVFKPGYYHPLRALDRALYGGSR